MTPSDAVTASRRLSRSSREPRCTSAPRASSAAAVVSERARPTTSCPASRNSGITADPTWPDAPVMNTRMEIPPVLGSAHRCDVLDRRISGGAGGAAHYEAGLAAGLYVEAQRA